MENTENYFHAIQIVKEKCTGCTHCVGVCPTEAIRVRDGKVRIDGNRCIDCGRCIMTCPYDALKPKADSLDIIHGYKYKIAILSSAFASQFKENIGYEKARSTVKDFGFDEVADEAEVADLMLRLVRETIDRNPDIRPLISSSCPAVVRLIQVRFPSLLDHILPLEAPMSILSRYYRQKTMEQKGLKENEIGIFQIVPCIAHVTAVHQPEAAYKQIEEGAFSIKDIYNKILSVVPDNGMKQTEPAVHRPHLGDFRNEIGSGWGQAHQNNGGEWRKKRYTDTCGHREPADREFRLYRLLELHPGMRRRELECRRPICGCKPYQTLADQRENWQSR